MLLLAVLAGVTGGAEAGAVVGFTAGLLADLAITTTPLGLSALAWCVIGWSVGTVRTHVTLGTRSMLPVVAFVATLAGVIVFVLVGGLAGQSELTGLSHRYLLQVALIESAWGALLALPVGYIYERAARSSTGARRTDAAAGG